jgi:hypothetical protein
VRSRPRPAGAGRLRPALRWALGGTLLLAAAALWWPRATVPLVAAVETAADRAVAVPTLGVGSPAKAALLPHALPVWSIEPAERDPFVPPPPKPVPTPPAPKQAPVAAPPMTLPAPVVPAPVAPSFSLRYLGRMVNPDGRELVLLARGDAPVLVAVGSALDEGYVVKAISKDAVQLVYPALGTLVTVPIPPPPGSQAGSR